jgi:hypothetical protein
VLSSLPDTGFVRFLFSQRTELAMVGADTTSFAVFQEKYPKSLSRDKFLANV